MNRKSLGCATIVLAIVLALFLLAYIALGNDLFGGIAEIFSVLFVTQVPLYFLCVILGLLVFAIAILFLLPFCTYVFSKVLTYISIWFVCWKEGYSCKLSRVPFAAIKGVKENADIEIMMKEKKIYVHFVDVPFGFRKVFTLVDGTRYCVSSTTPGGTKRIGGHLGANFSGGPTAAFIGRGNNIANDKETYKAVPEFKSIPGEYHYLVITPGYVSARTIAENSAKELSAETSIGGITVCKAKTLKKRLKNQLYAPMNNGQN